MPESPRNGEETVLTRIDEESFWGGKETSGRGKGVVEETKKSKEEGGEMKIPSLLSPSGDDISSGENKSRSAPVGGETVGMLVKHLTLSP